MITLKAKENVFDLISPYNPQISGGNVGADVWMSIPVSFVFSAETSTSTTSTESSFILKAEENRFKINQRV